MLELEWVVKEGDGGEERVRLAVWEEVWSLYMSWSGGHAKVWRTILACALLEVFTKHGTHLLLGNCQ